MQILRVWREGPRLEKVCEWASLMCGEVGVESTVTSKFYIISHFSLIINRCIPMLTLFW